MKGAIYTIVIGIIATVTIAYAQTTSGNDWLVKIDKAERVDHSEALIEQTITTSSGSERTLTMKSWSAENGDLSLMAYTAPARVKGDKILLRDGGDNIWYYLKRRDVTRHFAGHNRKQNAMGSDFSYEDLSTGSMTEDYTAEYLGEETVDDIDCIKLKLVPTESGPSYDHLILWAGKEDAISRKIDYYDDEGMLKSLSLKGIKEIDGRATATEMVMVNLRENSKTSMKYLEISFNVEPDLMIFNTNSLARDMQ